MKLLYFGHSCFLVTLPPLCGGVRLLFDPFLTNNPAAREAGVDRCEPDTDYVLISHGHYDHVDDAVRVLVRTKATAIASYEVCHWLQKHGVPEAQLHQMNIGGTARFAFGSVQMVRAVHSSSMPDGSAGGSACGFVIRTPGGAFYYSGDTALTLDMQLIPRRGPLDFAVLSLGDTFTMDAEDALEAARLVGCNEIVGVHCNTWPPIAIDQEAALTFFSNAGRRLHLPAPGAELSL